jgi:hypothetical protein
MKIRECLLWVLLLIMAGTMLTFFAMAWWPYKPLRIDAVSVDKTQVCRGDEMCFQFTGEKFYEMPVNVLIELVDGERYQVMKYTSNMPKGTIFRKRCFIVPHFVKPGKYQIVWSGAYEMNAFNTVHMKARSEWIQVGKK